MAIIFKWEAESNKHMQGRYLVYNMEIQNIIILKLFTASFLFSRVECISKYISKYMHKKIWKQK